MKVDPALARFDYLGYALAAKAPTLLVSSDGDRIVTPANMRDFEGQLKSGGSIVEWASVSGQHGLALRQ